MWIVKEHKSSYAMILIWQSIAVILGPLIGGPLVHDSEDKGGNYCRFKRQHYIIFVIIIFAALIGLRLIVLFGKSKLTLKIKGEKFETNLCQCFA